MKGEIAAPPPPFGETGEARGETAPPPPTASGQGSVVSSQSPPIAAQRRVADHAEGADGGAVPCDRPKIQEVRGEMGEGF